MVSETAAECVVPPLVALMEMLRVPVRALELTLIVAVELPAPGAGTGDGLKLTVTPEGKLDADRETAALKVPAIVVVTVVAPLLPRLTVTAFGETNTAKLGGTVTVRFTAVVCVMPPPVPVIVIG